MATNILLLCYICLFFYFSLLGAEISPGRRHSELRGPPRRWDWDQAVSGFRRQPVYPTLQGLGGSFNFLFFLKKRQSGDCPIECSPFSCCYEGFSTCCEEKCCPSNTTCINSVCCPMNAKVCPNGKCTFSDGECCPAGHTCGGTDESGINFNDTCCGDSCCYFGAECCGNTCCSEFGEHCCGNKCCSLESEHCCGGICCPKSASCVANGTACEGVQDGRTIDYFANWTVTHLPETSTSSVHAGTTTSKETALGSGTTSIRGATRTSDTVGLNPPVIRWNRKLWVLGFVVFLYYLM